MRAVQIMCVLVLAVVYCRRVDAKLYLINEKASWFEAHHGCRSLGRQLASINSADKTDEANRLMNEHNNRNASYWTGGTDLAKENVYTWWSNGKEFGYTNWKTGKPTAVGGYPNCVMIAEFRWLDHTCAAKNYYLCENDSYFDS